MVGFTESPNISVAAAIIQDVTTFNKKFDLDWHYYQKTKEVLHLIGLKNSIKK
jgi:hypothetical protein